MKFTSPLVAFVNRRLKAFSEFVLAVLMLHIRVALYEFFAEGGWLIPATLLAIGFATGKI